MSTLRRKGCHGLPSPTFGHRDAEMWGAPSWERVLQMVLVAIALVGLLLGLTARTASADGPPTSYTIDSRDNILPIPQPYVRELAIDGLGTEIGPFKTPSDLFVDGNGSLYVADTGNSRIVKLDRAAKPLQVFGKELQLKEPQGVFVSPKGDLFIADTGNGRVVHADANGRFLREYRRPDGLPTEERQGFKPSKVVVDRRGYLYVLEDGSNAGIIVLDAEGRFRGFFGATRLDFNLQQVLVSMFATQEQRRQIFAPQPVPHTNFFLSPEGFLYTVVGTAEKSQIQKLNPVGVNIFRPGLTVDQFFGERTIRNRQLTMPQFTDITVDKYGIVSAIDKTSAKIYQYDQSRRLLAVFGGEGRGAEQFDFPAAIEVDDHGRLYVLDGKRNTVYRLRPTPFAQLIHEASQLYFEGHYEKAAQLWNEVLRYHAQYEAAHVGSAKALLRQEKFAESMAEFELASNREGYSRAFAEYRYLWLREHFGMMMLLLGGGMVGAIALAGPVRRTIRRRREALARRDSPPTFFGFLGILRHPEDTLWELRERGSLWAVPALLLAACALRIASLAILPFHIMKNPDMVRFWDYLSPFNLVTHYHLREVNPDEIGVLAESLRVLLPFVGWVLVTYAVGVIADGEGSFRAILRTSAYCLAPYILLTLPVVALAHVLTRDERSTLNFLLSAIYAWTALLHFLQVKVVHDFSFWKTVRVAAISLFGMAILFGFTVLVYLITSQLARFGWEVLYELSTF